jgi:plasmid maintenance system antidote protein VapI
MSIPSEIIIVVNSSSNICLLTTYCRSYPIRLQRLRAGGMVLNETINSTEHLIVKINEVLKVKRDSVVNIINDKLTLSVFSELAKNLKNVKQINFIIRDTAYLPSAREISREFEITPSSSHIFFNSYEITEKNKLKHFVKAKSMYEFIKKHVNVRKTR